MFSCQRDRSGWCFTRCHLIRYRTRAWLPRSVLGGASIGAVLLGSALLGSGCSGRAGDLFPRLGGGGAPGPESGGITEGIREDGGGGVGLRPSSGSSGAGGTAGASGAVGGTTGGSLGNAQGGRSGGGASPVAGGGQGLGSGGRTSDGGAEPELACDPCPCSDGPFGEPEPVLGLEIELPSFGPAPAANGLTLLFSSIGETEDIFFATRTDRSARFSAAALVPGLSGESSEEGTPFLTADGSEVYFFSTRPGAGTVGGRDLWRAAALGDGFAEPSVVPRVNFDGLDHLPRLTPDGLELLFVSGRETSALASNIWVAERDSLDAPFEEPTELEGVNTDAREEGFWLSRDGRTLYFASNRFPDGDMDIFVAVRPDRGSPFEEAQNLAVVNTPGIELDPALTSDGFELFFASDRSGTMQLYRSARLCP
jgi:Tol biopolymer transport system component